MKKTTFLALCFLSIAIFGDYTEEDLTFTNLKIKTVMSRLFDNPLFVEGESWHSKSEPVACWEPNYAEKGKFETGYGPCGSGFSMTSLDTLIFYYNDEKAIMIFDTWGGGCHACRQVVGLACFEKNQDNWLLTRFEKDFLSTGHSGYCGDFSVVKLGDNFYSLRHTSPSYFAMGYTVRTETFYNLGKRENLKEVFAYKMYESDEGAGKNFETGEGKMNETKLTIISNSPYDIIITETRTNNSDIAIVEEYQYSEESSVYELSGEKENELPGVVKGDWEDLRREGFVLFEEAESRNSAGQSSKRDFITEKKSQKSEIEFNTGSNFSSDEAEAILRIHNEARTEVGVPPLEWSGEIAAFCQEWTDHLANGCCCLQHRPKSGIWTQKYGENGYSGTYGYHGVESAMNSWLSEKSKYTGHVLSTANWSLAGHYTQMVWSSSRRIGCGKSRCGNKIIIFCNYYPPGNYLGRKPYKK